MRRSSWWAGVVAGFVLAATPAHADAAVASCYGDPTDGFLGQQTADGTTVTSTTVGIAHRTLPFTTYLWVKVGSRRPIRARVMDRGPFIPGRTIDVTWGLAKQAGFPMCADWGVQHRVRTWRAR